MVPGHRTSRDGMSLVLVGLGNIGSQLTDHLGRMSGLARVVLIDRDRYESGNLRTQKINRSDLGRSKVSVQAGRLRKINPDLEVIPIRADLEQVPWGWLMSDLIVAGLDSVGARISLNEIAWRLGVPWIDGGVEPDLCLTRVNAYRPGEDLPCYECALDDGDYRNLGTVHPCHREKHLPAPTNGSAALGALTAALLALESEKIIRGADTASLAGRQAVLDPDHKRFWVSDLHRNPGCRFEHRSWGTPEYLSMGHDWTLGHLLASLHESDPDSGPVWFELPGHPLVEWLRCPQCASAVRRLHFLGRYRPSCPSCRSLELRATGFEIIGAVKASLDGKFFSRTLRSTGLKTNDLLRVYSHSGVRSVVVTCEM